MGKPYPAYKHTKQESCWVFISNEKGILYLTAHSYSVDRDVSVGGGFEVSKDLCDFQPSLPHPTPWLEIKMCAPGCYVIPPLRTLTL